MSWKHFLKECPIPEKEKRVKEVARKQEQVSHFSQFLVVEGGKTTSKDLSCHNSVSNVHVTRRTEIPDFRDGNYEGVPLKYMPTLQELADILRDEWGRVSSDPVTLKDTMEMIITIRVIDDGIVLPWFKYPVICHKCGLVLLDHAPEGNEVVGCCWCHSANRPHFA